MAERRSSRHLIASELAAALDYLPDLDFSQGLEAFRTGLDARMRPPLPPELEAVVREERFVPGLDGAPDVRVPLYTPPGAASAPRPAVLHVHGGGYIIGPPEINDGMTGSRRWRSAASSPRSTIASLPRPSGPARWRTATPRSPGCTAMPPNLLPHRKAVVHAWQARA